MAQVPPDPTRHTPIPRPLHGQEVASSTMGLLKRLPCGPLAPGGALMVSCAGDNTVKIWACGAGRDLSDWSLTQTVNLGTR